MLFYSCNYLSSFIAPFLKNTTLTTSSLNIPYIQLISLPSRLLMHTHTYCLFVAAGESETH